ncbi:MAG: FimV/HubP family polar landmark protein [Wenzhouxiangella sp.]|jgi:pilus assembly protein FimV|nr:FimV/HubP family polar landmark protein [Wenzhouxiangella sp.]
MIFAKARMGLTVALVVTVLFCQSASASIGLGEARVQSFLGQNLDVRIALVQSGESVLEAMEVSVASAEDHARLGVPSEALALGLSATLDLAADPPVIRLRSSRPVTEPFVQVLLNARWASGRLLREYTLFLDPPAVPVAPPVRRAEAPAVTASNPVPVPEPLAEPEIEEAEPQPAAQQPVLSRPEPDVVDAQQPSSLVVQNGQTLWSIAADWRPDGSLTMNQAMLAILDSNPDAFIGDNVNRLRRGARLILPQIDAARSIPAAEAARRVREQTQAWEARRSAPLAEPADSAAVVPEPVVPEPERVEPTPETLEPEPAVTETADGPALTDPDAVETAEIESPPEDSVADPASIPRLELAPPDEDVVAEAAAIDAERQRLSGQLAELESDIALDGLQSAETDALVDQITQAIESGDTGGLMVASEDLARLEEQLREAREVREAEQNRAIAAEPVQTPIAAAPEPAAAAPASFVQRWMWPLIAVVVGLIVLAMLIAFRRSRAARSEDTPVSEESNDRTSGSSAREDQVAESTSSEPDMDDQDQDAQAAALMGILSREDEEEESYRTRLTSEAEPQAMTASDRDDGAPDLARLSDRLDPEERGEAPSAEPIPETLAIEDEDIETLFASSEPAELEIREDPEDGAGEPLTLDFEATEQGSDAAGRLEEDEPVFSEEQAESALDSPSTEPADADEPRISIADPEIDDLDDGAETGASSAPTSEEPDWFALENTEDDTSPATEEAPRPSDEEPVLGDEDAEVKLDLARAYISMEDPDSARTLLDEVLSDGSPSHREQAQKLLDSLR